MRKHQHAPTTCTREIWRRIPSTAYSVSTRNRVYNHEVDMMFKIDTIQIPKNVDHADRLAAAEALVQMSKFVVVHVKNETF